jgi:hypothetical protein
MPVAFIGLLLGAWSAPQEAHYLDNSFDLDGSLADWRFVDLQGSGDLELALSVARAGGERELRLHGFAGATLSQEPRLSLSILPDVVGWGVADVRAEAGRELVFLTRSGAWSYSTTLPGYRDNVARLTQEELLYDMPDAGRLLFWEYFVQGEGFDRVLLPGREQLSLWGPAEAGSGAELPYARWASLPTGFDEEEEESETPAVEGDVDSDSDSDSDADEDYDASPFLPEGNRGGSTLLADAFSYAAPALLDIDGDGFEDLITLWDERLAVFLGHARGFPAEPSRVEPFPEAFGDEDDVERDVRLVDVDGDARLDLIARIADEADGFENRVHRLLVYRGKPGGWFGEQPDQVLRFEAGDLEYRVVDVDGDGSADLQVEKLVLPSLVGTVTGIEFTFERLLFLGERGRFARRPAFKDAEKYDAESAFQLATRRNWRHDCNGDGIADLVELDLQGNRATSPSAACGASRGACAAPPGASTPRPGSASKATVG